MPGLRATQSPIVRTGKGCQRDRQRIEIAQGDDQPRIVEPDDGHQDNRQGVAHLQGLTKLQSLNLSGTQVTDSGLLYLKRLTNLQTLYLNNTQVTDRGLGHLTTLTNLQSLFLKHTTVTEEGVRKFGLVLPTCGVAR